MLFYSGVLRRKFAKGVDSFGTNIRVKTYSSMCFVTLSDSFLLISPQVTCKTGQMSVRPSVRCQHFQNPKFPGLLARRRCLFYGSEDKTSEKRNFEFRRLRRAGD